MIHNPQIIFLDEITTGLDAISRKNIINILHKIKNEGKNIILVSHYYEEIWKLCDYILVLGRGKTLFNGKKDELSDNYEAFTKKIDSIIGEE